MISKCVPTDCKVKQSCYRYQNRKVTDSFIEVTAPVTIAKDCDYFIPSED